MIRFSFHVRSQHSIRESLHFEGVATPACLLTSSMTRLPPRGPRCTADSSAALRATAPVRSLVHVWPCSATLQPLLRLPFPATPILVVSCAHLTFHHSLSCPISRFPYAFLTVLRLFLRIFCLDTGFECLPLLRLPLWRYRWNRLMLCFPKHSNLTYLTFYCM
jgi:hypothetical protein